MINSRTLFVIFLVILGTTLTTALECYVCENQEDNNEKCVKSIKTCEQEEDVCLTEIKWGSTPYWTQGALKQFYISKRCSTKKDCEEYRSNNMGICTHIWYDDWKCSECCKGDRCNYYIISSGRRNGINMAAYFGSLIFYVMYNRLT